MRGTLLTAAVSMLAVIAQPFGIAMAREGHGHGGSGDHGGGGGGDVDSSGKGDGGGKDDGGSSFDPGSGGSDGGHGGGSDSGHDDSGGHGGGSDGGGSGDDHSGGHGSDDSGGSGRHGGHGSDDSGSDDHGGHSGESSVADDSHSEAISSTDKDATESASLAEDDAIEFDREGYSVAGHRMLALATSDAELEALQDMGLRVVNRETLDGVGLELAQVEVPGDRSAEAALAQLAARPGGAVVALNHLYSAGRVTGPLLAGGRVAAGIHGTASVGMIDGDVEARRMPAGTVVASKSFATGQVAPGAHGTAVAALLARSGAAHIYAANVVAAHGASVAAIVRALDWMATQDVAVINISLAGPPNPIVERMLTLLQKRGFAIVAAMGNDGPAAPPLYPAAYPDVIAVTAVDGRDQVYRRANRGAWTMLAAHGVDVAVVGADGAEHAVSGTSFAAPVVSAQLAALLTRPDPAVRTKAIAQLVRGARDLGPPGRDAIYGYGLISEPQ